MLLRLWTTVTRPRRCEACGLPAQKRSPFCSDSCARTNYLYA
ncbi:MULTISPECIES: hypothetical protein [unclassified Rathayibacter]|nr:MULTISPECIES: hypothetical protein [unclassified Rathayibacter]